MNMNVLAINYSINGIGIAYLLLPRKLLLRRLSVNIIWPVPIFLITAATKHPTFLKSMVARRTQKPDSRTNAIPDPQIGLVSLNNNPQVAAPFLLYAGLPNSFGWSFPSTNYIPNKIPDNPYHIV